MIHFEDYNAAASETRKIIISYLFDNSDLPKIACGSTFYKRDISSQTHPVHVVTGSWAKR